MSSPPPKVLLFDIGGVCVVSPFAAILAYEKQNSIPIGWINTAISASGKHGAWALLERGKIPLDSSFFRAFSSDLCSEPLWRQFYISHLKKTRKQETTAQAIEEAAYQVPAPPKIDGEKLLARERGDEDGVQAGDIVFFDDIGTNLRTGRQVGMRTVKVELGRADKAVVELERLTGLSLLEGGRGKL
ncbi:HAD-like protein [Aureobasidium pullulans]|nr:HAD-like protein [Aureobasidium pullulans]